MLKGCYQNKILTTLSDALPDDRPITDLQVLENLTNCPENYIPITYTHDEDQIAALSNTAKNKKLLTFSHSNFTHKHFLCFSKSQSSSVVGDVIIVTEKSHIPPGYELLTKTFDTREKLTFNRNKKYLGVKFVKLAFGIKYITGLILCSKWKFAPEGFQFVGEINGITLCYKMGNVQDSQSTGTASTPSPARIAPQPPSTNISYPSLSDYENVSPSSNLAPKRPAPKPPQTHVNYHTIGGWNALEGVPFTVDKRVITCSTTAANDTALLPIIKARTMQQLLIEYNYDFRIERQN